MRPISATMLDIVTMRGASAASSVGSSSSVRANGPRKSLPNWSSNPSGVVNRLLGAITPALLTSTCTGSAVGHDPRRELAHARQLSQVEVAHLEPRTGYLGLDLGPGASPFDGVRTAMMTVAPAAASRLVASFPRPCSPR